MRVAVQSQAGAVAEVVSSTRGEAVPSIQEAGLACEVEDLYSSYGCVFGQVARLRAVPYYQIQAYQDEVANHHPLPLAEVCEHDLGL